jgi:hypothetical protein
VQRSSRPPVVAPLLEAEEGVSPATVSSLIRKGREWGRLAPNESLWVLPGIHGDDVAAYQFAAKPEGPSWKRVALPESGHSIEAAVVSTLRRARKEQPVEAWTDESVSEGVA